MRQTNSNNLAKTKLGPEMLRRGFACRSPGSGLVSAIVVVVLCAPVFAQTPPPKPSSKPRSLDQQLLDDLDRQLLEGLPGGTKPSMPAKLPADESPAKTNPPQA